MRRLLLRDSSNKREVSLTGAGSAAGREEVLSFADRDSALRFLLPFADQPQTMSELRELLASDVHGVARRDDEALLREVATRVSASTLSLVKIHAKTTTKTAPPKPPKPVPPPPPPPPKPKPKKDDKIKIVELVEVYTEKKVEKTAPPAARKQYINLDDTVDDTKKEYGRVLRFKARIEWVSGEKKSLAGQNVYWYFTAAKGNRTGLKGGELEGFDSAGGAKNKTTKTDDKGWTEVVKFNLSQYGGDSFDVSATDDAKFAGGLKAGSYTAWRKFWYQVTEMKTASTGKFDVPTSVSSAFEAGYKTVFMEYEEIKPRKEAAHKENLPSGSDRSTEAKKYFTADTRSPFKCHIMTIDYAQTDNEAKDIADTIPGTSWKSPAYLVLWKFGGGTPWKLSAQYQPKDGSWTDIPAAALSLETHSVQPGFKKIKVDLSSVTPAPKTPIELKLRVKVAGPGIALGWGGGSHHLFLSTGALRDIIAPADRDPTQKSDAVHEIGHALGLVNMAPTASGAHDTWEDTTHKSHCKKAATVCAMFWQSSTTRLTTFHKDSAGNGCHDHLRRQDFSRSVMKNQWKD